jgi:hypothetical protein
MGGVTTRARPTKKTTARPKRKPPRERGSVARRSASIKMPQTARSKTEERMEEHLRQLEPGTLRHSTLERAIEFKRSWIHLAEHLSEIAKSGRFKEWGYRTFEAYAQHELHLRRETALKLARSYEFMSSHESGVLEAAQSDGSAGPLPAYQALDVLAEARANPHLSERDYREIRDQVFGDDLTPSQVRKMVREKAPEPLTHKRTEDPSDRVRRCLQLAERLYGLILEEDSIPERIAKAIEEAVGGLRRLLEE